MINRKKGAVVKFNTGSKKTILGIDYKVIIGKRIEDYLDIPCYKPSLIMYNTEYHRGSDSGMFVVKFRFYVGVYFNIRYGFHSDKLDQVKHRLDGPATVDLNFEGITNEIFMGYVYDNPFTICFSKCEFIHHNLKKKIKRLNKSNSWHSSIGRAFHL